MHDDSIPLLVAAAAGLAVIVVLVLWLAFTKVTQVEEVQPGKWVICIKCRRRVEEVNRARWCYECFSGGAHG